MISLEEEISNAYDTTLRSMTIVRRRIYCDAKTYTTLTTEEENDQRAKYGRTIVEIHEIIRESLIYTEPLIYTQDGASLHNIETKIERSRTIYTICAIEPQIINPVLLTIIYDGIDDMLEYCDIQLETIAVTKNAEIVERRFELSIMICEHIEFLNFVKEDLTKFYLDHPYRTLQLSDQLSKKLLTVDVCLSPAFLPYISGEYQMPKWMVPRTVRTINDARMIYQRREYVKEEGMNLFVMLAKSPKLPLVLLKMIAGYAVDLGKLRFKLCDVVTEEMLRHRQYEHLVYGRSIDITTLVPSIVIIV